jgi:hypothetical protein
VPKAEAAEYLVVLEPSSFESQRGWKVLPCCVPLWARSELLKIWISTLSPIFG